MEYQGQLLAGGDFPGYLVRWTGTTWTTFAEGLDNTVLSLAIHGTSLFVGGRFVAVVNTGDYIVRRDTQWRAINGGVRNFVTSIHVRGDSVYVGGAFTSVGPANNPVPSRNVAVIDMTQFAGNGQWKAIGTTGANGPVRALTESGGLVVMGGLFTQVGASGVNNIATFNPVGGAIGTFGSGLGGSAFSPLVRALHVNSGNVWAGGWFETAGGNPSLYVGRWGVAPPPTGVPVLAPQIGFAWNVGPNPLVADTRVSLALSQASDVRLTVHDVAGRRVATLLDESMAAGSRDVTWSAQSASGPLSSGVYYLRLAVNDVVETKSVVLTR
jgi:hypothetical protein